MKLRNLLLVSALFLSASVAFAGSSSVSDLLTMNRSEDTKTMNITMFRMNNGWDYTITAYTMGTNGNLEPYAATTLTKTNPTPIATNNNKTELNAFIDSLKISDSNIVSGLKQYALEAYQFTIPVPDNVVQIGITGKDIADTIYNTVANNGAQFMVIDNVIYFGKENWVGHYNNGAMFLGGDTKTFGSPLPAPVVTLLIALGFGAALVMYRNRKQVKA